MKKIILLVLFIGNHLMVLSQNNDTKSADYLFKRYEYTKAAEQYLKLAQSDKKNDYITKQLADCYYYTSNNKDAEKWYAKTLEKNTDKESIFRYSQVLKSNGKEEEAKKQMKKFASLFPEDLRAIAFTKNIDYAKDADKYLVSKLDLNTEFSEYGAFFVDKKLYFISTRNNSGKKNNMNNDPLLDIFESQMNDNKTFSTPVETSDVNSRYNDGPATLTANGTTMYFSTDSQRNNSFEKDKKTNLKLSKNSIYKATKNGTGWENIKPLEINSIEYSTSNPCVSRDGKTLYFSSNRPGGFGGVDVWKVAINADGTTGTPVNLGNKVNTEANESFPFISDDNTTLYFASNGKGGFGNYDVFSANLTNNEDAKNLGKSINTATDDFGFSFNDKEKIGFLASNRNGTDDLFMVTMLCNQAVNLIVSNSKTGALLSNAQVTVLDDNKNIIFNQTSNSKGEVSFNKECSKSYSVLVAKEGFEKKSTNLTNDESLVQNVEVKLDPIDVIITEKEVILKPIYFELSKWNITQQGALELNKLVKVMMENPEMKIFVKSHTDTRDSDQNNLLLSEKRAKSTVDYIISEGIDAQRISGKGFGESEPKIKCVNCTEEEHAQNRRAEFLIVK